LAVFDLAYFLVSIASYFYFLVWDEFFASQEKLIF